jgi:hypothetical protein
VKPLFVATLLGQVIFFSPTGFATEVPVDLKCPARIMVQVSPNPSIGLRLNRPLPDWVESAGSVLPSLDPAFEASNRIALSQHALKHVGFSSGPPQENAWLKPDTESRGKGGKWTSSWEFSGPQATWFTCHYVGTPLMLSKKLPSEVKFCALEENFSMGLSVLCSN